MAMRKRRPNDPGLNLDKIVHLKKRLFLRAFCQIANVAVACRAARVARSTHYQWLEDDKDYLEAYEQARRIAIENLEAECWRRATQGVTRDERYRGQLVGTRREYSDVLAMFLLKGLKPEVYKDRVQTEITGKDGQEMAKVNVFIGGLESPVAPETGPGVPVGSN